MDSNDYMGALLLGFVAFSALSIISTPLIGAVGGIVTALWVVHKEQSKNDSED